MIADALWEELFKILLAGSDLDIQHILFRWKNTNEMIVVSTRGMIGHIEI